jgi:hypothetical protein
MIKSQPKFESNKIRQLSSGKQAAIRTDFLGSAGTMKKNVTWRKMSELSKFGEIFSMYFANFHLITPLPPPLIIELRGFSCIIFEAPFRQFRTCRCLASFIGFIETKSR